MAAQDARSQAAATMRAEMAHQVGDAAAALQAAARELRAAAELARSASQILSVGIGDSDLVGQLAAELCAVSTPSLRAVPADRLHGHRVDGGTVALCHSISGSTSITVAAARHVRQRGGTAVAITAQPGSEVIDAAAQSVVLDIPRYPPDAKVPGTLTVVIPLAAVLCVTALAAGRAFDTVACGIVDDLAAGLDEGRRRVEEFAPRLEAVGAVHIVVHAADSATAAHLQGKLAESVGLTAAVSTAESWLHVAKHAVDRGVLVILLDRFSSNPSLARAVSEETIVRGGTCASALPGDDGDAGACRLREEPPLSRRERLAQVGFAQQLCLHLLEQPGHWAPFQLHRLPKETVRGLSPRVWRADGRPEPK